MTLPRRVFVEVQPPGRRRPAPTVEASPLPADATPDRARKVLREIEGSMLQIAEGFQAWEQDPPETPEERALCSTWKRHAVKHRYSLEQVRTLCRDILAAEAAVRAQDLERLLPEIAPAPVLSAQASQEEAQQVLRAAEQALLVLTEGELQSELLRRAASSEAERLVLRAWRARFVAARKRLLRTREEARGALDRHRRAASAVPDLWALALCAEAALREAHAGASPGPYEERVLRAAAAVPASARAAWQAQQAPACPVGS